MEARLFVLEILEDSGYEPAEIKRYYYSTEDKVKIAFENAKKHIAKIYNLDGEKEYNYNPVQIDRDSLFKVVKHYGDVVKIIWWEEDIDTDPFSE